MAKKQSRKRRASYKEQTWRNNRRLQILGAGLLLLLAAFIVFSLANQQETVSNNDSEVASSDIGGKAPDFELVSNTGEKLALSDYRGQPIAVMFMHTW